MLPIPSCWILLPVLYNGCIVYLSVKLKCHIWFPIDNTWKNYQICHNNQKAFQVSIPHLLHTSSIWYFNNNNNWKNHKKCSVCIKIDVLTNTDHTDHFFHSSKFSSFWKSSKTVHNVKKCFKKYTGSTPEPRKCAWSAFHQMPLTSLSYHVNHQVKSKNGNGTKNIIFQ